MNFTVSESAAKRLEELTEGFPTKGLRIAILGGGCSGLSYRMLLDEPKRDDRIFGKVFIDPRSAVFLNNAELNFEVTDLNSNFKIKNPNEKSRCGCEASFSV